MFYQQGDVIIESVDTIPQGGMRKRCARAVLAEGEATGHAHVVHEPVSLAVLDAPQPATVEIELIERDGEMYLRTSGPTEVTHEEHKPISLPAGNWRVRKVREYDHLEEEAHEVWD